MSLVSLWREVSKHGSAWPFRHPVDVSEVPDYLTVIKDPVDLSLIKVRLRKPLIFYSLIVIHSKLESFVGVMRGHVCFFSLPLATFSSFLSLCGFDPYVPRAASTRAATRPRRRCGRT